MKRTISLILSTLIALSVFILPFSSSAAEYTPDVELYSDAYMLINLDDDDYPVVTQQNATKKMYPASLTKIATVMVALNHTDDLSQKIEMTRDTYDVLVGTGAQVAGIEVGDKVSILDLLYLSMVYSACDACEMLASYIGGTRETFIDMMNDYATSLGCTGTHFVNPTGLHDPDHYTTAQDIATMTLDALQNETFVKVSTATEYEYNGTTYAHTNSMLHRGYLSYYYEYAKGIKTGSTDEAGYCLVTMAGKDGYNYLAVVMGAPVFDYNDDGYVEKCSFIDAASLFTWAFSQLKYTTLFEGNEVISEVNVKNGKNADTVQLISGTDVNEIVPSSLDKSAIIVDVKDKPDSVSAPVAKGEEICTADIIYGDEVITTISLLAAGDVELSTFLTVINAIKSFFSLTVVRLILVALVIFIIIYLILLYHNYRKRKNRRRKRNASSVTRRNANGDKQQQARNEAKRYTRTSRERKPSASANSREHRAPSTSRRNANGGRQQQARSGANGNSRTSSYIGSDGKLNIRLTDQDGNDIEPPKYGGA